MFLCVQMLPEKAWPDRVVKQQVGCLNISLQLWVASEIAYTPE